MPDRWITLRVPLIRTQCTLGEGPIWDYRSNELHFLDIERRKVYHYHPESGGLSFDVFDEKIGCLALRKRGGLACAAERGFAVIEPNSSAGKPTLRYLAKPLDPSVEPYVRFNDGACDSRGRFFAGTLRSEDPPIGGQLWCYDPAKGKTHLVDDVDITDSNGLGWSEDEKTLFFTNSQMNVIYAYDYDIETGAATNRRVHIDTSSLAHGDFSMPDGLCIDSEGGIWSARWGGSKIVRFAQNGQNDVQVSIPSVFNVTACCFGGPDLDQLYITTASATCPGGDSRVTMEQRLTKQQECHDSGAVFAIDFSDDFKGGSYRHEFTG